MPPILSLIPLLSFAELCTSFPPNMRHYKTIRGDP